MGSFEIGLVVPIAQFGVDPGDRLSDDLEVANHGVDRAIVSRELLL